MALFSLAFLLVAVSGYFNKTLYDNYNPDLCENMENVQCQKVAMDVYNYTVAEIRRMTTVMRIITEQRIACELQGICPTVMPAISGQKIPCSGGTANGYECSNIDLLSFVPLSALGSGGNQNGNDIWGYTSKKTNRRYAITGQTDGSSIVDVTDPLNPVVLCFIQSQVSTKTTWRDMKPIKGTSGSTSIEFITVVADRSGQALQQIPLEDAIDVCAANKPGNGPYVISRTSNLINLVTSGVYTGGTNTHNVVAVHEPIMSNGRIIGYEPTDKVVIVGSNSCSGGLLVGKINSNFNIEYGGCFSSDGYTHDAECLIYPSSFPDSTYHGSTICFAYNENSITIVDITNENNPVMLSRTTYSGSAYTHQGWLSTDGKFILMNDELDESRGTVPSQTTYIMDVNSLREPKQFSRWYSQVSSIDHNLYIRYYPSLGTDVVFESNYRSGIRLLSTEKWEETDLTLLGYFKTWQGSVTNSFNGAWSSYPYFEDPNYPGLIIVQDIEQGLFILDAQAALNSVQKN